MSDDELEKLADMIAARMPKHPPACVVFSDVEVLHLKGFLRFCEQSRVTALATVIGFLVLALLGAVGAGIIAGFKKGG
jgi:hypothetical protein